MAIKMINDSSEISGIILTRGIRYSESELRRRHIVAIYNASGDHDLMGEEFQKSITSRAAKITGSPWVLSESSLKGKEGRIVSVLVFYDLASMVLYALEHKGIYGEVFAGLGLLN